MSEAGRAAANEAALDRLISAEPVLVGVATAGEVVPGMTPTTILTSGAPLPWGDYVGLQRSAILWGAVHEGLAATPEEADQKLASGAITLGSTQRAGCAGVHAGIFTARTPVFVVEERRTGKRGFCTFFEGEAPRRLGFGYYDDGVRKQLANIEELIAPICREAVALTGGIELKPIARRALQMGDDLHARCVAGTLLFSRALTPALLEVGRTRHDEVRRTLDFMASADHFFYRIWMAGAKATLDAAAGIDGSSLVTTMAFNCRDFAIQVSGLGDAWFRGPHPSFEPRFLGGKMGTPTGSYLSGSDCMFSECVGLGAFASAAAFNLQGYQGVPPAAMIERTRQMYAITLGEHPDFTIPFLEDRGVPVGIDLVKVVESGVAPVFEGIIVRPDGSVTGTAVARAPLACFEAALAAFRARTA